MENVAILIKHFNFSTLKKNGSLQQGSLLSTVFKNPMFYQFSVLRKDCKVFPQVLYVEMTP
jgi:hypothetical protein